MTKLYFNIKEFTRIRGGEEFELPDKEQVQAIIEGFMLPLNECRTAIGLPMYINSGYRPHLYELRQGRNGASQHCFNHDPEQHDELFGACDVTSAVNEKQIKTIKVKISTLMMEQLIEGTEEIVSKTSQIIRDSIRARGYEFESEQAFLAFCSEHGRIERQDGKLVVYIDDEVLCRIKFVVNF